MNVDTIIVIVLSTLSVSLLCSIPISWCNGVRFSLVQFTGKGIRKCLYIKNIWKGMNLDIAKENLLLIHDIFSRHNIFFYLSDGTALGFKREGYFIEHDDDVDICIYYEDYPKFIKYIIPDMKKNGFKITQGRKNFTAFLRKGVDIDIEGIGKDLFSLTKFESCNFLLPYIKEFDTVIVDNKKFKIPKGTGFYEYAYGIDWNIPIKQQKSIMGDGLMNIKGSFNSYKK